MKAVLHGRNIGERRKTYCFTLHLWYCIYIYIYIFELTITDLGRVDDAASSHTVDRPFSRLLLFSKLALALQTMTSAKNLKDNQLTCEKRFVTNVENREHKFLLLIVKYDYFLHKNFKLKFLCRKICCSHKI